MAVISFHSSSGSLCNSDCFLHVHHFNVGQHRISPGTFAQRCWVAGCCVTVFALFVRLCFPSTLPGSWLGRSVISGYPNRCGGLSPCQDGTRGRAVTTTLCPAGRGCRCCWGIDNGGVGVQSSLVLGERLCSQRLLSLVWLEGTCQLSVAAAFALPVLTE